MASSSGEQVKRTPHFSCMELPTLVKKLRGILSEYPDGGQILKELIQNADDAGATELKIMLESRRINRDLKVDSPHFTKFFQAPALCIYNDAEFTEKDWRGIQMIDKSVKKKDSLKIGRFGLGFKSVFHITDNPCVISGNKMLLMDPQKPKDKVNATVKIDEIHEIEGMDTSDIFRAVGGKYGFDENVVKEGYFRGTMFWFPLREKVSPISKDLYDISKVEQLFSSLNVESSSILIFLKSLTRLYLLKMTQSGHEDHVLKLQIQDEDEIRRKRNTFFSCIKNASSKKDEECVLKMTIQETTPENTQLTQWLVVNYYIVHNASNDFRRLIQNPKLGLSPCVGVAAKIEPLSAVEGHIFCFLPLPKEGTKLTGLPFHVNGFFALSQNRHHLKWATDDQDHQYVSDEILWNEKLLTEALPLAFQKALDTCMSNAVTYGNKASLVEGVYLWITNLETVLDKWKLFIVNALKLCQDKSIMFCDQCNSWKRVSDVVFTRFLNLPDKLKFIKSAVRKAIGICGKCPVERDDVFLTYNSLFNNQINDISPVMLADILKQNPNYKYMTDQEKNELLAYLISEGNINNLEGLELLLLASGEHGTYEQEGSSKYLCTEFEVNLFPGSGRHFIIPFERIDQCTQEVMRVIFESKHYPIRDLDDSVLKAMLLQTLQLHLGPTFVMTESSTLSISWLRDVWSSISSRLIHEFLDISVFPVLESGSFESSYRIKLVPLQRSELVLKSERSLYGERCLNCDLEKSLRFLGITVITQLPSWLSCNLINDFVVHPALEDVNEFLQRKASTVDQHSLDTFNNAASESSKARLLDVFAIGSSINDDTVYILQKLRLFRSIKLFNCPGKYVSADQNTYFIRETEQDRFPVNIEFPEQCILVSSNEETVAQRLGCTRLTLTEFMRLKLEDIRLDVSTTEKESVLVFFLSNIEQFTTLIDMASTIPFIQDATGRLVKPSEIFDPFDNLLCRLFCDEHVFPADIEALRIHRKALTSLGMKGISNVRTDDVYNAARAIEFRSGNGENMCNKAKALQEYIEQYPIVLRMTLESGVTLGEAIKDIPCFAFCSPEDCTIYPRFPKLLKWFSNRNSVCPPCKMKDIQFWELVCSSMPLVKTTSSELSSYYDWNTPPFYDIILTQLQNIRQCYISSESKLEFMPMIITVYQSLSQHLIQEVKDAIYFNDLVYTDENFKAPSNVVVLKNEDDIDLKPYVYFLPRELVSMQSFFTWIGCTSRQDEHVLVRVLKELSEKYSNGLYCPSEVKKDLKCAQLILEKLAETNLDTSWCTEHILMIVQSNSDETLTFAKLADCVYDDDPAGFNNVDYIDKSCFVHEHISSRTAEKLGVKSATRKFLEGAHDIDQWGQHESFTKRLKSLLLNGYTDGLSVPKELLQNADDAGATDICFVYDERKHLDSRQRLLSKKLADFQGPAMWCYNDKMFSEKDFENITKFNNSAKVEDLTTIGKFGLGINTVYNITEIPSFISGADMMLFDPQEKYLDDYGGKSSRGKRIPLSNRHLVHRRMDQFRPFQDMFECNVLNDPFTPYHGTLFRFPLRTAQQADTSEICQKVYSRDEIKCLFEMLIQSAGKLLLFCQNVSSIKLYHISALANSPHDMKMIYMVQKDSLKHISDSFTSIDTGILRKAVSLHQRQCDSGIEEHHTISVKQIFFECEALYPN